MDRLHIPPFFTAGVSIREVAFSPPEFSRSTCTTHWYLGMTSSSPWLRSSGKVSLRTGRDSPKKPQRPAALRHPLQNTEVKEQEEKEVTWYSLQKTEHFRVVEREKSFTGNGTIFLNQKGRASAVCVQMGKKRIASRGWRGGWKHALPRIRTATWRWASQCNSWTEGAKTRRDGVVFWLALS